MLIADSQVHIWEPNSLQRPWAEGRKPHREVALRADDLLRLMDEAGVSRAVLVPPSWDHGRNDLALKAAQIHPQRFAIMGRLDLKSPDAREKIVSWCEQPGMLGLRFSFTPPHWASAIAEGRVDWLWKEAEHSSVPMMLIVTPAMLSMIGDVAKRHPGLKLAMCHLALPGKARDETAFADLDKLIALAKWPNIAVKASALPAYTTDQYPYRRLHPYLRRVYDAFGPQRMFWGTDYSRLECSYRQAVTMFTEEIEWLTAEDRQWIMGRGLCEWLGWKVQA